MFNRQRVKLLQRALDRDQNELIELKEQVWKLLIALNEHTYATPLTTAIKRIVERKKAEREKIAFDRKVQEAVYNELTLRGLNDPTRNS